MLDAFDRMNTRRLRRDELMALALEAENTRDFTPLHGEFSVGLYGTSGRRGLFVVSRAERERYAGVVLAKGLPRSVRAPPAHHAAAAREQPAVQVGAWRAYLVSLLRPSDRHL